MENDLFVFTYVRSDFFSGPRVVVFSIRKPVTFSPYIALLTVRDGKHKIQYCSECLLRELFAGRFMSNCLTVSMYSWGQ